MRVIYHSWYITEVTKQLISSCIRYITKHITDTEQVDINDKLEFYDANGDIDYMDYYMNSEVNIRLCTNENSFKLFHKAVLDEINVILTTFEMVSKCLGDLIQEYYDREQ